MRKVLFVAPTLSLGGAARRLTLLLEALQGTCDPCLAILGADSRQAEQIRAGGTRVEVIPWRRPIDYRPLVELRKLVREFGPEVVHAWGLLPLSALALCGGRWPGRTFVSEALTVTRPSWPETWLLRRAGRVVAFGTGELERYRHLGVREERLSLLPLAVKTSPGGTRPLPPRLANRWTIVGLGPIESHKGFHEAVWTFDILRHNIPDLQLVLVGPGNYRGRVAEFARWLQISHLVHIVGEVEDVSPWIEAAHLVWVPSLRPSGVCAALEGMAAGKPVLASRLPGLAEVVADGETGVLIRPGDKPSLARQSRQLLQEEGLRLAMGEAARRRARELFGLERLREEAGRLYGDQRGGLIATGTSAIMQSGPGAQPSRVERPS